MSDDATMAAIQARMEQVRRDLSQDLATSARDITDWRSYVRARPWLAVASAACVGYLLAPKSPPVVKLSGVDLEKLVHEGHATAVARVPKQKKSWTGSIVSTLAGLAARSAIAYFTQQLSQPNAKQRREQAPL